MGLIQEKNGDRSELQQRLDAQLRAKAAERQGGGDDDDGRPDGVDDSAYMEGTAKTTGLAGAWVLVIILALVAFVGFVFMVNAGKG